MFTQIIRTIVTTAVREITRESVRTAIVAAKPSKARNTYYRGR